VKKRKFSEVEVSGPDPAFKLKPSKSPVIDALVYCSVKGWGIHMESCSNDSIVFQVTDFNKYYQCSQSICSKLNPTDDVGSRIKTLQRWFPDFPSHKEIRGMETFRVVLNKSASKLIKL